MRTKRTSRCLLVFTATILFFVVSCNRDKRDFYTTNYPSINFTLSLPNALQVHEMYEDKKIDGGIFRNVDSNGVNSLVRYAEPPANDTSTIEPKQTVKDPNYFFAMINRKNSWNMNFTAILSAKWQDTAVVYDLNRIRQHDFQELYVYGPGKDSAFYAGNSCSEIEKNGRKLIKISNPGNDNTTYTGMVGKYWFMLQFIGSGKDSAWVRQIWDQSSFD